MSESSICPHARQAARDAFRGEADPPSIPEQLPAFDTPEAYSLEDKIKPYYYGKLGQAIGMVATEAMQELPSKPLNWRLLKPWSRLAADMHEHFSKTVENVMDNDDNSVLVDELSLLLNVRHRLIPRVHPSLKVSLWGGSGGYALSSAHQLRLMKSNVQQLGILQASRNKIYRHSHGQMRNLASTNELQFESLRTAVSRTRMPGQHLNSAGTMLQLDVPLSEIPTSVAHPGIYVRSPQSGRVAEVIGDIQANTDTVGCPILLTPKLTEKLWNYTVDVAENRNLL